MMCAVYERIACVVAHCVERFDHLLDDVVSTMIQDVRHVLHKESQGLQPSDVLEVSQIKVGPRVNLVGLRMLRDLTQLGAANTCVCLTGRAAYDDVDSVRRVAEPKIFDQCFGIELREIARLCVILYAVRRLASAKIDGVGTGCQVIKFCRSDNFTPRGLEPQA